VVLQAVSDVCCAARRWLAADDDAGGARSPGVPFGGLAEGIDLAAVPALSRSAVRR
jgi:hypothetical protein